MQFRCKFLMSKVPVSLYLDTRRAISSGENKGRFPVKLRVDFSEAGKRQQKYFHTGVYLNEKEYQKATSETPGRTLRDISVRLVGLKAKAVDILETSPYITAELFELLFTGKAVRSANVEALFRWHIDKFDKAGRIKSRDSYELAMRSILDFSDGHRCTSCRKWVNPNRMNKDCPHDRLEKTVATGLLLNNIDVDFLERYEFWMIKELGNSVSTVGIYLRNLRAVFNDAIEEKKVIARDLYPFGRRKYRIPSGENIKKAMPEKDKVALMKYEPANESEAEALDFWKFSYYSNGINPIDIAYLHEDRISEEAFEYVRKKTETTERNQKVMQVPLHPVARQVLERRGIHSPYVFGIITPDMSEERKRRSVENFVRRINKNMEKIAKKLGIRSVTTYTARHTVATTLIRNKVPLSAIKDILGHAAESTTERYVNSIDFEEKKKIQEYL